jgi:polygalacturonase
MTKWLRLGALLAAVAITSLSCSSGSNAEAAGSTRAIHSICNVRDFGAKGDGKSLDTRPLQAAIDACAQRGGTVYLGAGNYVSGTLRLRSHVTLKLDHGAVLSGSHNIRDYWPSSRVGLGHTYGTDIAGEGQLAGLLVATNVNDVAIEGPGTIDGQSDSFMSNIIHKPHDYAPEAVRSPRAFEAAMDDPAYGPLEPVATGRPGVLVLFFHARDVSLKGVNLRNSPNWTLVMQDMERATISDFSIIDNPLMPNNDGIDCMDCRDVHIHDGTIRTGDDDVVLVNSQDVTVSGLSMYSRSAAVRMESTQRAVLEGLTIESNRGLAIFASRQISRPTDSVLFSNIVMRTRLMPGHWWGKAEPIYISVQPCDGPCRAGVRNVVFSNIEADAEAGVTIAGTPAQQVKNVELRDVRLRMVRPEPPLADAIGGNFDRRWTAGTPADGIVRHDIPAIYCASTQGFTLHNVEISWSPQMPAYSTEALQCEDSSGVVIDGFSESGAVPKGRATNLVRTQVERTERVHLRP